MEISNTFLFWERLLPGQLADLDPVGLTGGGAQPSLATGFIVGVISGKPDGLAVPLKSKDVVGGERSFLFEC